MSFLWRNHAIAPRCRAPSHWKTEYGNRLSNDYINAIRDKVDAWRALGDAALSRTVTPITARLLRHWRDPSRSRRLFFCQIGAVEAAIWLAEAAHASERDRLRARNAEANPDLFRIAFKLATVPARPP